MVADPHLLMRRHLVEGPCSAARGLGRLYERVRGMDTEEFADASETLAAELERFYVERGAPAFRAGVSDLHRLVARDQDLRCLLQDVERHYDQYDTCLVEASKACMRNDYAAMLEALWAAQQGIAQVRPGSERLLRTMGGRDLSDGKPAWLAKYLP